MEGAGPDFCSSLPEDTDAARCWEAVSYYEEKKVRRLLPHPFRLLQACRGPPIFYSLILYCLLSNVFSPFSSSFVAFFFFFSSLSPLSLPPSLDFLCAGNLAVQIWKGLLKGAGWKGTTGGRRAK